jgi:hypothetical protein
MHLERSECIFYFNQVKLAHNLLIICIRKDYNY